MKHITLSQRNQLQALVRARHTQQVMAEIIGCSQSTICRELSRNSSILRSVYTATTAQKKTESRREDMYRDRFCWHDDTDLRIYVETELKDGKSPDQIAGRIKYLRWSHIISHQSIYTYIEKDKEQGGNLYLCLRYQGKKYKWRGFNKKDKTRIPNRKGIEMRPEIVNTKGRSGDWESDLVVSSRQGSGAVATFAERTSIYFRAILVANQSADEMVRATYAALAGIPEQLRLTMTHDNGKEITKHDQITELLNIDVYCARPYRSCDRGLNEWMNRELRRFFPKGTDFSQLTQSAVRDEYIGDSFEVLE